MGEGGQGGVNGKATPESGFLGNRQYGDEHKTKFLNYLNGFLNHWEVMYPYKIAVHFEKGKRFSRNPTLYRKV